MAGEDADLARKPAGRRRSPRSSGRAHRRSKLEQSFYGSALDSAEQIELEAASDIEGLDKEIALLRMKLRAVLSERPEDLPLMLRSIELLVKVVSARYRLSKQAEEDLAGSLAGVIRGVGGLLIPEAFSDE